MVANLVNEWAEKTQLGEAVAKSAESGKCQSEVSNRI